MGDKNIDMTRNIVTISDPLLTLSGAIEEGGGERVGASTGLPSPPESLFGSYIYIHVFG